MDSKQSLSRLLADTSLPASPSEVLRMHDECPAFYLPALILLKRNPHDLDADTMARLQAFVAMACPDREALADFVDVTGDGWDTFYPLEKPAAEKSTEQTIDDFLRTYGHTSAEDDALIEQLIFNPAPADYFQGTDEPYDPSDPLALPPELADSDSDSETETEPTHHELPQPKEDDPLMESLAKIYIKRQRYSRAYEIISKLSLKYPEKSVYFADQLRFLQKLIINQQHNG